MNKKKRILMDLISAIKDSDSEKVKEILDNNVINDSLEEAAKLSMDLQEIEIAAMIQEKMIKDDK